ncbi:MAG: class I SAM-dependent methyltransferase [Alphaproteobacteria bacterium]
MSEATDSSAAVKVTLTGVPETMLWPLWFRAAKAGAADPLLDDPMAIELVRRIDYDFAGTFGRPHIAHAIRARWSDDLIRGFLAAHPGAVVASLGEGLETQFWRVDDGRVQWLSIDLPEAIALRRRLLPAHERLRPIERSALDTAWFDEVPAGAPLFVTAAGLLMYFGERDVVALLRAIAERFPNAELFFDTIPPWFSRKTLKGMKVTERYTAPPMPFALPLGALERFAAQIPGLRILEALTYAEPFPDRMRFFALVSRIRWLKNRIAPGLVHARFEPA